MNFSNLKLKYKISIIMIPILVILSLLIGTVFTIYYSNIYQNESEKSIQFWNYVTTQTIEKHIETIKEQVLLSISSSTMQTFFKNRNEGDYPLLAAQYDIQNILSEIKKSDSTIEDVYIIDNNNSLYLRYISIIKDSTSTLLNYDFFSSEFSITVHPIQSSPFSLNSVIPVSFHISYVNDLFYPIFTTENPNVTLLILIDANEIIKELDRNSSEYLPTKNTLLFNGVDILKRANSIDTKITISTPTSLNGLEYLMLIDDKHIINQMVISTVIIFIICIVASLIGTLLILYTSSFLTRPFRKLSRMIEEIKNNSYKLDIIPEYNDETGILIDSINSLYITIQNQIELIRKSEKEKYKVIERLLIEQINPHFIYNTLELINMEIINGNTEAASEMIITFSRYLRFSLNSGNEYTTILKEKEQTLAYIAIMNKRLNKQIRFTFKIDSECEMKKIPKLIIQPLVENSIKHGFSNTSDPVIFIPEINIQVSSCECGIILQISDNGFGINHDTFFKALNTKTDKVGLSNIRQRLEQCFSSVSFTVESIPYFKNTVTIYLKEKE